MTQRFCFPFILESSGWRKYGDEEVILCLAGDAFDVEIDGHASIDALKKEILKRSPIKIQCDTKDLKLFLAKKGDAWLPYNDPAVLELKEGKIHEDIQTMIDGEEMDATQRLEDVLIANNMTKRKRGAPKSSQIHILVVVPEGRRRSANRNLTYEEMLKEIYAELVLGKLDAGAGEETPIDPFDWARSIRTDGGVEQQRMLYIDEEEVKVRSNFQALSELVALDLRTNDPVALLTDLNDTWIFYWVAEKKNDLVVIHRAYIGNPSEGFRVIRTVLEKSSADIDAQIELPYFERPVKRLKLRPALSTVCGESGSIGESIQRYYDIVSMLGPDEDMAREVAGQVVRSIPAFSYFS